MPQPIPTIDELAALMPQSYNTKVRHYAFDGATDPFVRLVHEWMPNNKQNAVAAAHAILLAWRAKFPDADSGMAVQDVMAAAHYIIEVEPHRPKHTSQHDVIMLAALRDVKFGHFNNSKAFVQDIAAGGVRTDRQRWWLTTLVVRHRKQVRNQAAVQTAERWLRTNPEPGQPAIEPVPTSDPPPPPTATPASTLF